MKENKSYYLKIIICDSNNDKNELFKCLSSINNQIGFDLKNEVIITLITNKSREETALPLGLFNKLTINYVEASKNEIVDKINNSINNDDAKWITFMRSKDLLFADGSLLDFIVYSRNDDNKDKDAFVFNYVYPIKNEKDEIVNFGNANYLNVIFGKYFKLSYLKDNQIYFNNNLNQYLTDDYSSRAIELSNATIWFELNNYYLSGPTMINDNFDEFCKYRREFIIFMKEHSKNSQQVLKDTSWSIVHAFYMLKNNQFNYENRKKLMNLFTLIKEYTDYNSILEMDFNNKRAFKTFKRFMEV